MFFTTTADGKIPFLRKKQQTLAGRAGILTGPAPSGNQETSLPGARHPELAAGLDLAIERLLADRAPAQSLMERRGPSPLWLHSWNGKR